MNTQANTPTDEGSEELDVIEAQLAMADEAADDVGDFSVGEEFSDEEGQAQEAETAEGGDGSTQESGDGAGANVGGQQEAQSQAQPAASQAPAVRQDQHGNLVDEQGNVVAQAGAERRVYQQAQQMRETFNMLQQEHNALKQRWAQNEEFIKAPERMGLSNEQALFGLQLINDLRTKPVEAARQVLQTAVAQGYNIQDILGSAHGQQSPVNMGAISQMIEEKMQPFVAERQEKQQRERADQDRLDKGRQFIATHEHSQLHLEPMKELLDNNPSMTPEQAYYEVKTYALSQGYDFTQPLGPQVQARMAEAGQQQQPNTQVNQPNRGIPNGNASRTVDTQSPNQANGNDDWDAIVRESMAESGMNY